jgi:sterol desaturase/sphingolipid hydroxylase (fatty acid hydroxylase superfamily)
VDSILAMYRDPLFLLFPVAGSLVSMAAYLVFAIPLTWIAYADPPSLRKYRIQERRMEPGKVIGPAIRYWVMNNLIMTAVVVIGWPIMRHTGIHTGPLPAWWVIALQIVFFIYLDDFLFYWLHRALHSKLMFRRIHSVHHRATTPWACSAQYLHPVEFVLTASLMLVGPNLLGSHVVTIWIWIVVRQWLGTEAHTGYSFPWNPTYLLPGYGGTEYHDFHHAKFTGNYAAFLGHLDRIFGTSAPRYLEHLAAKRERRGR